MAAGSKLLSPLKIGRRGQRTLIGKVVTGATPGKVAFTATFGPTCSGEAGSRQAPARP